MRLEKNTEGETVRGEEGRRLVEEGEGEEERRGEYGGRTGKEDKDKIRAPLRRKSSISSKSASFDSISTRSRIFIITETHSLGGTEVLYRCTAKRGT